MNPQQIQQAARDEALVPTTDRQFWFTVKKVKKSFFYQFAFADKNCQVNVELFCKILRICPRVPREEFVAPPFEESLLTFLIELRYKGQLNQLSGMFVDHMHQPWRTLATIINKCLSWKSSSNDRLRQSRVRILWGMFHKKNVDFVELIWEDFQYQIDYGQSKSRRREIMPYLRFTKIIINYFLSQHKSIPKRPGSYVNTIMDDGVFNRLKFVGKGEDYQVYGIVVPDTMLTDK
ncbi:hypothetical protein Tco_0519269 [Tanacetum coccineum]